MSTSREFPKSSGEPMVGGNLRDSRDSDKNPLGMRGHIDKTMQGPLSESNG